VINAVDRGVELPGAAEAKEAVGSLPVEEQELLLEAAAFRRSRRDAAGDELARVARELPLPRVDLPLLPTAWLLPTDIAELARVLEERSR
jgi:hypothetical protein